VLALRRADTAASEASRSFDGACRGLSDDDEVCWPRAHQARHSPSPRTNPYPYPYPYPYPKPGRARQDSDLQWHHKDGGVSRPARCILR
jgi:hypothetical protein